MYVSSINSRLLHCTTLICINTSMTLECLQQKQQQKKVFQIEACCFLLDPKSVKLGVAAAFCSIYYCTCITVTFNIAWETRLNVL